MGLGCVGMSEFYGTTDESEAEATIHRALEFSIDFLDTADMYGTFTNERLVGQAIAGRRDEVVLATKWLCHQGQDTVPIPGTKRRKCLEENAGAAGIESTESDRARIEEAAPKCATAGERYTDMGTINR